MYNTRAKFVNKENLDTIGNLDFLIYEMEANMEFLDILKIMNRRKIQKSMLIINENEEQNFKVINPKLPFN